MKHTICARLMRRLENKLLERAMRWCSRWCRFPLVPWVREKVQKKTQDVVFQDKTQKKPPGFLRAVLETVCLKAYSIMLSSLSRLALASP